MAAAVIVHESVRRFLQRELGAAAALYPDRELDSLIRRYTATDTQTYTFERVGTGEWRCLSPLYPCRVLTGISFTGTADHVYLTQPDGTIRGWLANALASGGGTTTSVTDNYEGMYLNDSAADFSTDSVTAGDLVLLTASGLSAEVLAVNSATQLWTEALPEGTAWASVDRDMTFRTGTAYAVADHDGTITDTTDPHTITARPVDFQRCMVEALKRLWMNRSQMYDLSNDAGAVGSTATVASVLALLEYWKGARVA